MRPSLTNPIPIPNPKTSKRAPFISDPVKLSPAYPLVRRTFSIFNYSLL
jgi:hypothetical protein